jgi:hypothetical protein
VQPAAFGRGDHESRGARVLDDRQLDRSLAPAHRDLLDRVVDRRVAAAAK